MTFQWVVNGYYDNENLWADHDEGDNLVFLCNRCAQAAKAHGYNVPWATSGDYESVCYEEDCHTTNKAQWDEEHR